jgi:hypothetical protein
MQACFASPREAAAVLPLMDRHMGLVADWASGTPVGDAAGG